MFEKCLGDEAVIVTGTFKVEFSKDYILKKYISIKQ